MPDMPRCFLTMSDRTVLEELLEHRAQYDEAFLNLLRRKLSTADAAPHAERPADVAGLNSRVDFTVDGRFTDSRILVHGGEHAFPDLTLSITTLRGLALLGLTKNERIVIENADGRTEALRLNAVSYPPASNRGEPALRSVTPEAENAPARKRSVVSLAAWRRPAAKAEADGPIDPDDDPGPRAA